MANIDLEKIVKAAAVSKVQDRDDIDLYSLDFTKAGYNSSMDVEANTPAEARKKAKESLESSVDSGLFDQLMPKIVKNSNKSE